MMWPFTRPGAKYLGPDDIRGFDGQYRAFRWRVRTRTPTEDPFDWMGRPRGLPAIGDSLNGDQDWQASDFVKLERQGRRRWLVVVVYRKATGGYILPPDCPEELVDGIRKAAEQDPSAWTGEECKRGRDPDGLIEKIRRA